VSRRRLTVGVDITYVDSLVIFPPRLYARFPAAAEQDISTGQKSLIN
jgi:hypothetical protein